MDIHLDVRPDVQASIQRHAQRSRDDRETGGILLGRGPDAAGLIVVDQVGDPGPKARREPDFFLRDLEHAKTLAAAAWAERRSVWVGEWHTHPTGDPRPSASDLTTYRGLLNAAELAFTVFLSIIVVPDRSAGWDRPRLTPWVFQLDSQGRRPPQLTAEGQAADARG